MELSEDQKQQILEEEKRRLAEEQYREHVRKELLDATAAPGTPPPSVDAPAGLSPNTKRTLMTWAGGLVAVCGLAFLVNSLHPGFLSSGQAERRVKLTTAQIAEEATPSTVVIENFNENGEKAGQGSGYVYSDDGKVITNYDVIRGAVGLNLRLHSGASYRVDSVVGYDIAHDIAVLQVPGISAPPLPTQDVERVKVGDKVVAIGAPSGGQSTISEGIISALREVGGTHIIQTTTSISPGSGGGPLLDEFGKVIGLTTAPMGDRQNLIFAIPAHHISDLLKRNHPITLSEMLTETRTARSVASNTFSVPPGDGRNINLNVPMQQGAVLEGSYEVRGGGDDVEVVLTTSDNRVVLNSGRVSGSGQIKVPLPKGNYILSFNNQFSTFTSKSVSPDLKLAYYR